jgi:hypothetical protein
VLAGLLSTAGAVDGPCRRPALSTAGALTVAGGRAEKKNNNIIILN